MIEAIISNPYPVLGALLLASFVGYVNWRNGFKVRRAAACATFRASVLGELGSIYPKPVAWPDDIHRFLRSHFTALQSAVENFRPFVPWWRRRSFDKAWFRYHCATGREVDANVYHHYMPIRNAGEPTPDVQAIFHANVSDLLSFANET